MTFDEAADALSLLPQLIRTLDTMQLTLHRVTHSQQRMETFMSQALDDVLARLDTSSDQIISLLTSDKSERDALQSSVDALRAAKGDDSAEVAKAQSILDKLTLAAAPAPTVPPKAPDAPPVVDPPVPQEVPPVIPAPAPTTAATPAAPGDTSGTQVAAVTPGDTP